MQETNPIRKAGMRVPDPYRYEAQVRDLFGPKHEFVNWTGSLRFGTSGRSVGIAFTPACEPQQVIQFGNAIEQSGFTAQDGAGTIIRTDSPIGRTLAGANSAEQPATASGTLVPVPGFLRFSQALNGQANSGYGRALFRSQLNPAGAGWKGEGGSRCAMSRYLLRRYRWRLLGERWLGPALDSSDSQVAAIQRSLYTCEPDVGKEVRRPGYPDVYRVTRILPNQPHWGGGVWGVRTGQQESTEAAAEWAVAKVDNLGCNFPSADFCENSIYWMREPISFVAWSVR
jgi:hypothetical protein